MKTIMKSYKDKDHEYKKKIKLSELRVDQPKRGLGKLELPTTGTRVFGDEDRCNPIEVSIQFRCQLL